MAPAATWIAYPARHGALFGLFVLVVLMILSVSRLLLDNTKALLPLAPATEDAANKGLSQLQGQSGNSSILLRSGQSLTSPNGVYTLVLEPDGDLILSQRAGDETLPLWWTATGDRRVDNGHTVRLTSTAGGHHRLEVQARLGLDQEATTVWHSDLEPQCHSPVIEPGIEPEEPGALQLSNSGRLRIAGQCDLFQPLRHRNDDRTLAVIVAGLYRTHAQACPTHVKALVGNHSAFSRVDVFAYMLSEGGDSAQQATIKAAVEECYGAQLRGVEVHMVEEVEEEYPGGADKMLQPCGAKLGRLNNQLKTVYNAGKLWRSWVIEQGQMHDTVLRIRPDTAFGGEDEIPFWTLNRLGTDKLVLPHPHGEHYFYCARMSGRVGVGPTDQIAYGSPAAMGHWLAMYQHFVEMVDLASNSTRPAHRDFSGCEVLPSGPGPEQCPQPAPCSIECLVAWYLESKGIQFEVEWNWNQNLLRG